MAYTVRDLVFAIDVTSGDHDIANFEFHDGANLVLRNAVTCGMSNPPTGRPGYETKAFAVEVSDWDNFNTLRDALRVMLAQLDAVEGEVKNRTAEKKNAKAAKKSVAAPSGKASRGKASRKTRQ